ncbi:type II secretion system protein N [Marinobacter subterrani]|uniref:Type II secretion system protein N n=1 Tax=Marinobacter subterrani TaxID=1658765 RepID=A0A0J7J9W8_9GAMM|nr:type II secretion system protein N [Marinobacter subterrani]KMQ74992.1 Type II secretion system (T2SS), protein N [Marinobacter subterrani]
MSDAEQKSFLRPGKVFLLLFLGALVYLASLVFLVPAGWVWQQASGYVPLPAEVQVQQVAGTLWDGEAGVVVAGFPLRVDWRLQAPSVTSLELPLNIVVESSQSSLEGDVTLGWPASARLDASGRVTVAEFEELIRQSGGAMIEGDVTIDRLEMAWADNRLTRADGLGRWEGGLVTWPMGDQRGQAEFPPMQATLDTVDAGQGGVSLTIARQGGDGPAADATILWNGMMELRVYKRMVDLAGQSWPDSASPGDVVFRVRQPLIPGAG